MTYPTFQEAKQTHHAGQLNKALELYQAIIKHDPNNFECWEALAIVFTQLNQYDNAIQSIDQALKIKPNSAEFHAIKGNILLRSLDYNAAAESFKKAIEHGPHPKATYTLAKLYYNEAQYTDSLHYFKEALKLQPHHADLLHDAALAFLANKEYDEAITQLEECLEINPEHPEAHYHLGAAYLEKEALSKALSHYLQQLSIQPSLDCYYNIGVIFNAQNRNDDAIPYFEEVLRLEPQYLNAHLNLAVIHLKFGHTNKAIHHYEEALKIQPDDPEIKYILAGLKQNEEVPETAPPEYLSHLFDQYALYYDKHLQEHLRYQVPEEIFKVLTTTTSIGKSPWKILDLGCGTGLSGALLKPYASELIGVDISENMLDLASQKNIYTELKQADISDYLVQKNHFNLIVAADVFSYHGELDTLFKKAHEALVKNGYFVFTVERGFTYPYHLQQSLRYTHTKAYLEELIEKHQFKTLNLDNLVLRYQQKEAVEGYLVLLEKMI